MSPTESFSLALEELGEESERFTIYLSMASYNHDQCRSEVHCSSRVDKNEQLILAMQVHPYYKGWRIAGITFFSFFLNC